MNKSEETRNFYNKIAEESFKNWFNNPALLPTLKIFINHLPKNPLVLDLGCGTGGESMRMLNLGANVIGIDFSEDSIALASQNVPKAEFILMDILQMDFPDNNFNGIIEAGVLFHFTEYEQNQILFKLISFLKGNGIFLSYYPEGDFEGIENINVSGNTFRRYSRKLPIQTWIKQVMNIGFNKNVQYEFKVGTFKCIEFYK